MSAPASIYLLIVTQGAAILLSDLTELPYLQSLIVVWLSYTVFTMYSGSKGVILTDTLMFLLFTGASLVFAYYIVSDLGGVAALGPIGILVGPMVVAFLQTLLKILQREMTDLGQMDQEQQPT